MPRNVAIMFAVPAQQLILSSYPFPTPLTHHIPFISSPSVLALFAYVFPGVVRQIATKCNYLTASTWTEGGGQKKEWGSKERRVEGEREGGTYRQPGKLRNFHYKHTTHKAKKLQVTQQSFGPTGQSWTARRGEGGEEGTDECPRRTT